jgi:hypothetical protein
MNWRDLTSEERAVLPEARLGGALLWITIVCAIAFAVPAIGMAAAFVVIASGGVHANPGDVFSWLDGPYRIGKVYMVPVVVFIVWSLLFVVMTLARLRSTPVVASAGMVLWVALRLVLGYLAQAPDVAAAENTTWLDGLVRIWPYGLNILAEVALTAGFCGYMAAGVRPNAYYRRRLLAP